MNKQDHHFLRLQLPCCSTGFWSQSLATNEQNVPNHDEKRTWGSAFFLLLFFKYLLSNIKQIRRPLSCSLHEIARIIGPDRAEKDLINILEGILKDQSLLIPIFVFEISYLKRWWGKIWRHQEFVELPHSFRHWQKGKPYWCLPAITGIFIIIIFIIRTNHIFFHNKLKTLLN